MSLGPERGAGNLAGLAGLPAAKLLLHLATTGGYGIFRDELYYLACASHLDFGYVDHPPLSVALLWAWRALFGDSLFALRLLPAVAGAATVLLVGLIARRLGGGAWAQNLAMIAALAAPIYLALDHVYSMNTFDVLLWALAGWLLLGALETGRARSWLLLGAVLGLGLQNKISFLWLGLGLAVGMLLTERRRLLATRGPWLAAGIALLLFLPHLVWQVVHDWPTLEFMARAAGEKMVAKPIGAFVLDQTLSMNPVSAPVWLAGLAFLLVSRPGRPHRPLGWAWVAVFLLLALSGSSRANYLAPAFTWLFAGGAVAIERLVGRARGAARPLMRAAIPVAVLLSGAALAPLALPLLPVDRYVAYAARLGIGPSTDERKELGRLPQFFADMHGWEEIAGTVAGVWESLPAGERQRAAIFAPNYGGAGAIDYFGRDLGLPRAISGHNSYWLWGPRGHDGSVVLVMGGRRERLEEIFERVELAATIDCGDCMPYENGQPVWICRGMTVPMEELWPQLKNFS